MFYACHNRDRSDCSNLIESLSKYVLLTSHISSVEVGRHIMFNKRRYNDDFIPKKTADDRAIYMTEIDGLT